MKYITRLARTNKHKCSQEGCKNKARFRFVLVVDKVKGKWKAKQWLYFCLKHKWEPNNFPGN